jgi:hypothetical protein
LKRAAWVLLCLSMMIGCEKSNVEILQSRLDKFRNILPPELRQKFDSGNYETVAKGIDSLAQHIPAFKDDYERLKHEELIDVFSAEEVVDFYREYFVEKMERLKQKKDSS